MRSRISFDPKILPIIFENWPPISVSVLPRQSVGSVEDATAHQLRLMCSGMMLELKGKQRCVRVVLLSARASNNRFDVNCLTGILRPTKLRLSILLVRLHALLHEWEESALRRGFILLRGRRSCPVKALAPISITSEMLVLSRSNGHRS